MGGLSGAALREGWAVVSVQSWLLADEHGTAAHRRAFSVIRACELDWPKVRPCRCEIGCSLARATNQVWKANASSDRPCSCTQKAIGRQRVACVTAIVCGI